MIRTRPHWRKHHSIPRIVFVTALLLLFPLRNARADSIDANAGSSIVKIDPATGAESTLASAPGPFQGISTLPPLSSPECAGGLDRRERRISNCHNRSGNWRRVNAEFGS